MDAREETLEATLGAVESTMTSAKIADENKALGVRNVRLIAKLRQQRKISAMKAEMLGEQLAIMREMHARECHRLDEELATCNREREREHAERRTLVASLEKARRQSDADRMNVILLAKRVLELGVKLEAAEEKLEMAKAALYKQRLLADSSSIRASTKHDPLLVGCFFQTLDEMIVKATPHTPGHLDYKKQWLPPT